MKRQDTVMKKPSSNSTSSSENNTDDSGILDFGTSVSVNDDMRRSIGVEIQEIEANCNKLKEHIHLETKMQQDLANSHAHANKELTGLNQSASDIVDTLGMTLQVLHSLKTTMTSDKSWVNVVPGMEKNIENNGPNRMHKDADEYYKKQILEKNASAMTELHSKLSSTLSDLQTVYDKRKGVKASIESSTTKIERIKIELENGEQYNSQINAELNLKKKETEDTKDEMCKCNLNIEKLQGDLEFEQSEIQRQDDELAIKEREDERRTLEIQEAIQKEDAVHAELTAEYSRIQEQIIEMKSMIEQKGKLSEDLNIITTEQRLVTSESEKIKEEINDVKTRIEADVAAINELQTQKATLTSRKHANDRNEVEGIIPARAELDELERERSKLDTLIEQMRANLAGNVSDSPVTLEKLQSEIEEAEKEVEMQEKVTADYREQLHQAESARDSKLLDLELRKAQSLEKRNQLETQIQKKNNEIMDREIEMEEAKRIQKIEEEQELQFVKKTMELLQKGKRVLDKTDAKVKNILDGKLESIDNNIISNGEHDRSKSSRPKSKRSI